jgi:WD40 repeat protein
MAMSTDNHWLATGSADVSTRLWTLRPEELITLACRTAGRNMTVTEWQQYFSGELYRNICIDPGRF